MEDDDDNDLKLMRASAAILSDLEESLPKLIWRKSRDETGNRRVHTQVKRKDLDYIVALIEPFQGDPQLLDARLKYIVPPLVEAYLQYSALPRKPPPRQHLDFQDAVSVMLYTLCKVRGYKVIVGFFNNEPRYLDAILGALETVTFRSDGNEQPQWQTSFVLLLWLSHLVLAPFDLATISDTPSVPLMKQDIVLPVGLPNIATRILRIGLHYLTSPSKPQERAAALLLRLVQRPDMQQFGVADWLVKHVLRSVCDENSDQVQALHERLGAMRVMAGIGASSGLTHLIPEVCVTCEKFENDSGSFVASNAVAKKLNLKTLRNVAVLALHSSSIDSSFLRFVEHNSIIENVIDYLLRALDDRDTPVRQAAAKAIGLIILELQPEMGQEVVQAVLDAFKEDMPRHDQILDFRTANALRWHGLTLTLAHILFKRSASAAQLPEIVEALALALQFEQRTATGSSIGTNIRDAANFGIWSLSRRYTTAELLSVDISSLRALDEHPQSQTVIQWVAVQLISSACFDPAGNIRRGSSAALQELIGRHPDQVHDGIALVQIVDYQSVGLRKRAMVEVAKRASALHDMYWSSLSEKVCGWRGLGSADVVSREAAAQSLAELCKGPHTSASGTFSRILHNLESTPLANAEAMHGWALALALLLDVSPTALPLDKYKPRLANVFDMLQNAIGNFSSRVLRSELASAATVLLSVTCRTLREQNVVNIGQELFEYIDTITSKLLQRFEDSILKMIPRLVCNINELELVIVQTFSSIDRVALTKYVRACRTKMSMHGAGQATALGALISVNRLSSREQESVDSVSALCDLTNATNVSWRIIGLKALQSIMESTQDGKRIGPQHLSPIVEALDRSLNDYTIDERGDVGSLVRLEAIACVSTAFTNDAIDRSDAIVQSLHKDIYRLSVEKLDRVRHAAAKCRDDHFSADLHVTDLASVSSFDYFYKALKPLKQEHKGWEHACLLEGSFSTAGLSAEPLLQACRAALLDYLSTCDQGLLFKHMNSVLNLLKSQIEGSTCNTRPTLETLAFLLDMGIPQRLVDVKEAIQPFKWRALLSCVQKAHHKSADIPKLLSAIRFYRGLADVPVVTNDILRKLLNMLQNNPYPSVRVSVAEALFAVTGTESLLTINWTNKSAKPSDVLDVLTRRYGLNI